MPAPHPAGVREERTAAYNHLRGLIAEYDRAIAQAARDDARSKRLMNLLGIGPTTASALMASLGGAEVRRGIQIGAGQNMKQKTVCQKRNLKGMDTPPECGEESPMHCRR